MEISLENIEMSIFILSNPDTWEKANYSKDYARAISNTLTYNYNKTKGILEGIRRGGKSLKLILIPKNSELIINYGSYK